MIRAGLRWKIVAFTALPLALLAAVSLWSVNRSISRQVDVSIRADLVRASAVFEQMLGARSEELTVAGLTIVRDPKFFSVLTLPGGLGNEEVRNTVAGVAQDFNVVTRQDLFEVLDDRGRLIAAASPGEKSEPLPRSVLDRARAGQQVSALIVRRGLAYQVSLSPAYVGGRLAGWLLLGARVSQPLAERLRDLTRSEVTFVSRGHSGGSTLTERGDLAGLLSSLGNSRSRPGGGLANPAVLEVRGGSHRYLTLTRPMPGTGVSEGQFFVLQRSLDSETAFLRNMQRRLVQFGFLALFAALLAGFLIARSITRPIQQLVRAAEAMERGHYEFPIEWTGSDEVAYLSKRFAEMRQHLKNYVVRLEEVTRLKSDFLNVASHEIRTPISVIQGYQELLEQKILGPLTEPQAEAVRAIGKSTVTLARIAEDATRMAQIDQQQLQLEKADHDVAELLHGAVRAATSTAHNRKVEVLTSVSPQTGTAWMDGGQMFEALGHLVKNAIRFTPDGGRVEVRARRSGATILFEVRDTGIGIDPERQREIFEKPLAAHDTMQHHSSAALEFNSAGLGLGLPIALGIARAHGGELTVESEPGRGSVFTLVVPAGCDQALEEAA